MARVNVVTSVLNPKSPARTPNVGMWLVEVIEDSFPTTYQGMLERESITGRELTLQLLANALTVLKKLNIEFDSVEMYFNCEMVERTFENKWLEKWSTQEWKNAKGKEVADKELWMMIWSLLVAIGKRYIVSGTKSSYANWMQIQTEKEMEKIRNREIAEESIRKIHEKLA